MYIYIHMYIYRVYRETSATAHRKVDKIEMNVKVPYRFTIFAIIIEILIFEIVLMRAHQEKRSSRSRYSPVQFIKHWLPAASWGKKESAPLLGDGYRRSHVSPSRARDHASMVATHNRDYNIMRQIIVYIMTLQK